MNRTERNRAPQPPSSWRVALRAIVLTAALLAATASLSGCGQFLGWFGALFITHEKVPPAFEPPKDRKVLVFVDDPYYRVEYEPLKGLLTEGIVSRLEKNEVAREFVSYDKLLNLMDATPDFNRMRVSQVGSRLGADYVIYVQVESFSLRDGEENPLWHGKLKTSVRVVGADGERLWPKDRGREGHPVKELDMPEVQDASPTYGAELSRIMADIMADRIAKLFYEHEIPLQDVGIQ